MFSFVLITVQFLAFSTLLLASKVNRLSIRHLELHNLQFGSDPYSQYPTRRYQKGHICFGRWYKLKRYRNRPRKIFKIKNHLIRIYHISSSGYPFLAKNTNLALIFLRESTECVWTIICHHILVCTSEGIPTLLIIHDVDSNRSHYCSFSVHCKESSLKVVIL